MIALLGALGVAFAWATASPVGASPDESAHIVYAWGTATGQTLPGRESTIVDDNGVTLVKVTVPADLYHYPKEDCYARNLSATPTCGMVIEPSADASSVDDVSYMTRYPPLYYAAVGGVMRTALSLDLSGFSALYLARIFSGFASMAMVVGAFALLRRSFGIGAAILPLVAAATPTALSLFSAVNPNGFEIAGSILAAAACATVGDHVRRGVRVPAYIQGVLIVSMVALTWTRPLSVAWAGLLSMVLLVPVGARAIPFRALSGLTQAVLVLNLVAALGWLYYSLQTRRIGEEDPNVDWGSLPLLVKVVLIVMKFGPLLTQMVGWMGWDVTLPPLLTAIWISTVAALVILAIAVREKRRGVWVAPALLCGSVLVVGAYSMLTGFGWQGRYWLPAVAMFIVLLTPYFQFDNLPDASRRRLVRVSVIVFGAVNTVSLTWYMWRYVYGAEAWFARFDRAPLPFDGVEWIPVPFGDGFVVLSWLVSVVLLGVAVVFTKPTAGARYGQPLLRD
ncbi:DUF2142 domain-containing protein [Georgenia soli]|uniref:DUF2142 domain-containing protein n=1 Tax=Georgenia soli TaxID=638953 RepID=UPI0014734DD6|nr:DUF2142 domain-containing protein [Georgenia soli]